MFPVVLYLQIDSLVTHHPREVTDGRKHYYSEHRWLFGLNATQALLVTYYLSNIGNQLPAHLLGVLWTTMTLILSIVGFRSEQHKTYEDCSMESPSKARLKYLLNLAEGWSILA